MITKKQIASISKERLVDIVFKQMQNDYLLEYDLVEELNQIENDKLEKRLRERDKVFENYTKASEEYEKYLHELINKYEVPVVENEFKWGDLLSKCNSSDRQKLNDLATKVNYLFDKFYNIKQKRSWKNE